MVTMNSAREHPSEFSDKLKGEHMLNVILLVSIVVGSGMRAMRTLFRTQNSRTGGAEPPFEICPSNKPVDSSQAQEPSCCTPLWAV